MNSLVVLLRYFSYQASIRGARPKCRHVATCRLLESSTFAPIVRVNSDANNFRGACNEVRPRGANMINECSDWMSFNDAVAHVEATQKCYEELAIKLLQRETDSQKIRSRPVQGAPRWVVSGDKTYLDDGRDLQFCRADILRIWPEQQKEAAALGRSRIGSGAISVGVGLALDALWPNGVPEGLRKKDRNEQVVQWLKQQNKSVPRDVAKAVQRELQRSRML